MAYTYSCANCGKRAFYVFENGEISLICKACVTVHETDLVRAGKLNYLTDKILRLEAQIKKSGETPVGTRPQGKGDQA